MSSLTYHVGISLDGFIAHPDHRVDGFLMTGPHVDDFVASFADHDTVVMGRRTYEMGLAHGVTSPFPMLRQVVVSSTLGQSPDPAVEVMAGDGLATLRAAVAASQRGVWLCGGGALAGAALAAGLIDRVIVKLYPVVFGAGVPMFGGVATQRALVLRDERTYANGVRRLRYDVTPAAVAG